MKIWGCFRKCCGPIPQRAVVAIMVLTGLALQYIHRVAFNLTITDITFKQEVTEEESPDVCHYNETSSSTEVKKLKAEFYWDSQDQAHLVGGFYVGYVFSHLPGGVLADKYGPKRVLGYGVLMSAICSLVTPLCARTSVNLLVVVRIFMGLAQGPVFPALAVFTAHWSLPNERNFMSAFMSAGVVTGAIIGNAATGFLLFNVLSSWDYVFYIYSGLTLLWYVLWMLFAHDSASKHPFISEEEKQKIHEALESEINEGTKLKVPYFAIFKSVPVWAMIIAACGNDWAFYIIVTLMPQYMSYVLRFNVMDNGLVNCLPYIAMVMISLSSAKLGEIMVTKGWTSKTLQCKLYTFMGNMIPCICFILASYAGCNRLVVVILFSAAMGILGMIYSGVRIVNVDMSPNFAGTLMSLLNGFGSICGIFGPELFAMFTKASQTVKSWRMAFFVSTAIVTASTVVFIIWGSSEVQPWNFPTEPQQTDNEEAEAGNGPASEDKPEK